MKQRNTRILGGVVLAIGLSIFASCGGQTDGGDAASSASDGLQYVSNGGSGSTLRIELEGADTIPTGGQVVFKVTATDPNGSPLSYIRINCESEHGIAILEPSRGGVSFETTNASGIISGVLGGVTPGSYMLECRAPQGYNLVTRLHFKVVGSVPEGFDGFPGAAGGNLGGGLLVDPPSAEDVSLTEIVFTSVVGDEGRVGNIDNHAISDCDGDATTVDPEPFGTDSYTVTVNNQNDYRVFVQSIQYEVDLGTSTVSSLKELGGLVVQANSAADLIGVFTQNVAQSGASTADKYFAGTSTATPSGTYNVVFTVRMLTENGESIVATQAAAIIIQPFNNC